MSDTTVPVVDTHFHMWELNRFSYLWPRPNGEKLIYKDFLAGDYDKARKSTPIQYSIFVEVVESVEETKWVLDMTKNWTFLRGVVGFVDLTSDNLEETIIDLKQNPKFVGTRKILNFCEDGWLLRKDVLKGMSILEKHELTFDLLIISEAQYDAAREFLKLAPPNLKIVINHLGKPNAKTGASKQWFQDIETFASYPKVYCKLSGMVTEADLNNWKASDFKPHVDHVIKHFGIDRVMFGSDWPVCKLAGAELNGVYNLLDGLLENLSKDKQEKVFGGNAVKCYNLKI